VSSDIAERCDFFKEQLLPMLVTAAVTAIFTMVFVDKP